LQFKQRSIPAERSPAGVNKPENVDRHHRQYVAKKAKEIILSPHSVRLPYPLTVIDNIQSRLISNLCVEFIAGCSDKFYAQAFYNPALDFYLLIINKNKTCSLDYSTGNKEAGPLYHELGHIVLGHLQIPSFLKSKEDITSEDREADEFARLLVNAGKPGDKAP